MESMTWQSCQDHDESSSLTSCEKPGVMWDMTSIISCKRGDGRIERLVENVLWHLPALKRLADPVLLEKDASRRCPYWTTPPDGAYPGAHGTWGVGKDGCKRYCMLPAGYPGVRLPAGDPQAAEKGHRSHERHRIQGNASVGPMLENAPLDPEPRIKVAE